jgi:Holliday junction resolvase
MAGTPESKVKDAIKKLLKDRGIYYYMPVSNGMGRVGAPDIIACADGLFLGIECKAPGKRNNTTPNQRRELDWIRQANGIAIVVDDVQQVIEVLDDRLQKEEGAGHTA